jgi:hypothetical protein
MYDMWQAVQDPIEASRAARMLSMRQENRPLRPLAVRLGFPSSAQKLQESSC